VALVCNFGGGQQMTAGSSALLSHAEVETFLHELGHAMHSVGAVQVRMSKNSIK
jgi:Zn-dependent oligopeptidase